ncbi:MAG: hypothetical protein L0219_21880 [Phycisphaerales bacterium]|nr:hypothetical protein [Phycisphaerales bacterium]MCI0676946.1 hypothetical protein [Phycisphaerales bacterium]
MAVRSGAGTGVVVSLVVFILTTVFLLILSIVFYAGKANEMEAKAGAESTLSAYVRPNQRNNDSFKAMEAAARAEGKSVTQYLTDRYDTLIGFAGGDSAGGIEKLKGDLARFNLKENETLRSKMQDMFRDLNARQEELTGMKTQLTSLTDQLAEKDALLKQTTESHQQEMNAVEGRIAGYRDLTEEYRKKLDEAIDELAQAKDAIRSRYEGRVTELQNETDRLGQDLVLMKSKLDQLERARAEAALRATHPGMLVDGKVVDAPSSNDQIFIDRGSKDRIVLGMTFEVYSDENQIRLNPQTGELPRGKASLQVMKVNETTSTCKVTRAVPGNPIIRGDVVANAIYDPTYKFKFLVHGKFDIDGDGRPTETEAEYLRSLVINWGGSVISGDDLPGDLDFLVLGAEPPKPPPPPDDASAVVIDDYVRKNEAHDRYNQLFRQAREAQIPVLNSNRFFILIGHTDR